MKYRTPSLMLCLLGIVLLWWLPTIVRAIHDAHRLSIVQEFHTYPLIDRERLEAIKAEYSLLDYSVEQRAVGGIHIYLPIVTVILATLFGIVGILVRISDPASVGAQADSVSRDDEEGEPSDAPQLRNEAF